MTAISTTSAVRDVSTTRSPRHGGQRHTRSRARRFFASAWLWLPLICAIQVLLALRHGLNTNAFEDEGLYVYTGHRMIQHLLHGVFLPEYPGAYFSGAPGLYPVLAAMADSVGGLAAARGDSAASARLIELRDAFRASVQASLAHTIASRGIPYVPGSVEWADFDPTATSNAISLLGETALMPPAALTFWRWVIALFLVLHGLVHAAVWAAPMDDEATFDPKRSWLLDGLGLGGGTRTLSILLALVAMVGFVAVGVGLFAQQGWWRPLAVAAAAVSLGLILLYFNPWLSVGLAIEVLVLAAVLWADWPSQDLVGA